MPKRSYVEVVDLTLSLDTSAYIDGDVLADTQALALAFGGGITLRSVNVLDEDDQGQPFDLVFLDSDVSLGAENSAPNISDANARKILGRVAIAAADYYDLGGVRMATVRNLDLKLKPLAATLYLAAISRGTGTYTASGLKLKLGFD